MENNHPKSKGQHRLLARKLVALTCSIAVWFSINVGDSLQAAQSDLSMLAGPAVTQSASGMNEIANSVLSSTSGIAIVAVSLITLTLISYNLLTSGKRGWGWVTLCITAGILMVFARLGIALFREISSPNSVQDWDS